jgi:hypothetical protein
VIVVDVVLNFLADNWEVLITVVIFILAAVLTGKRLSWFKWFNELTFFAWDQAEKQGLLEGWKGAEKLRIYLEVWRREYQKKWGSAPSESVIEMATIRAAELSEKEKEIRLDPQ